VSKASAFIRSVRTLRNAVFGGSCRHRWDAEQRYSVESTITGATIGEMWILRCRNCGDVKSRRV
jgi:hypothetical protein